MFYLFDAMRNGKKLVMEDGKCKYVAFVTAVFMHCSLFVHITMAAVFCLR